MSTQTLPARLGRRHRAAVLLVMCGLAFLLSFDTAIHAIAVPTLLQQLGDRPVLQTSQWIPKVFVVVAVALLIVGGVLADRFGAKRVLIVGLLTYLAGALANYPLAMTSVPLIGLRAVMGVGSALMVPAAMSIVGAVSDTDAGRVKAFTVWLGCFAAGVTIVQLVSGLVLDNLWWPRIVAVLGLIAVTSLFGVVTVVPAMPPDPPRPVDWSATTVVVLGVGLVTFALIQGPEWGWANPSIAVPLAAGILPPAILAIVRRRGNEPLQDYLFRSDPRIRRAVIAMAAVFLAVFGIVFLVIQYLQAVRGYSPIVAGWLSFLPTVAAMVIGAKLGPMLRRQLGPAAALIVGLAVVLDGLAIGLTADATGDLPPIVAMVTLASAGFAVVISVGMDTVIGAPPSSSRGISCAARMTFAQLSGLLGLAIVSSLVDSGYHEHLRVPAAVPIQQGGTVVSRDSLGKAVAVAASTVDQSAAPLAAAVQHAFLAGYRHGLLAIIGVIVATMVTIVVKSTASKRRRGQGPIARVVNAENI
ncbi:MFS transporter [Nocardia sp. NPDC050175]|uniref:MFS transporter n=1 Tax=Nocardia sp. NPDC050175 TaxID=3364317 RepID=UPI0037B0484E